METVNDRLKEIKNLADSNLISSEEYYKLRGDILGEEITIVRENNNTQRLRSAGKNVFNIFYCIIIQPVLGFFYWFFIGFKYGYDSASDGSNSFNNFMDYVKNLSFVFYFVEIIVAIIFLVNLWNLGVNLKNVDIKL
jgi:hypothetical protein